MKNNKDFTQWTALLAPGTLIGLAIGIILKRFLHWEWGIVLGFMGGLILSFLFARVNGNIIKPPMKFAPGKFRNIILMVFVYIAAISVVIFFLEKGLSSPWDMILPAATLIPGIGFVFVFMDAILSLDEMQSKIMTQGITFAFFSSLMVFFTLGILELSGMKSIPIIYFPLIMAFFMAVGKLMMMRRY